MPNNAPQNWVDGHISHCQVHRVPMLLSTNKGLRQCFTIVCSAIAAISETKALPLTIIVKFCRMLWPIDICFGKLVLMFQSKTLHWVTTNLLRLYVEQLSYIFTFPNLAKYSRISVSGMSGLTPPTKIFLQASPPFAPRVIARFGSMFLL